MILFPTRIFCGIVLFCQNSFVCIDVVRRYGDCTWPVFTANSIWKYFLKYE